MIRKTSEWAPKPSDTNVRGGPCVHSMPGINPYRDCRWEFVDRGVVGRWILLGISFTGCVVAIWMMMHGHGIWNTPVGGHSAGLGFEGLGNVCIGGVWMICGFLLVLVAGQGLITGVIVGFLPREQWEEYSLDSVSVITNDELE